MNDLRVAMTLALTANLASLPLSTQRNASSSAGSRIDAGPSDARLKDALTALQALKRPPSEASEERKAAAAKKVEALKARIRMIRMAGGDPAAMTRAVAHLARELGAAVKAYAAAGGGAAALGLQGAAAAGPPGAVAADAEASAENDPPAEENDQSAKSAGSTDPYRPTIERLKADAAERARQNGRQEADAKFAAEARGLAAELKAMLREAQQKAKRAGDDDRISADQSAAEKGLDQVTEALADLAPPIGSLGVGLSISV